MTEQDIKVVQIQAFVGVADLLSDDGVDAVRVALRDGDALVRGEFSGAGDL